jgi:hypothetical protein
MLEADTVHAPAVRSHERQHVLPPAQRGVDDRVLVEPAVRRRMQGGVLVVEACSEENAVRTSLACRDIYTRPKGSVFSNAGKPRHPSRREQQLGREQKWNAQRQRPPNLAHQPALA